MTASNFYRLERLDRIVAILASVTRSQGLLAREVLAKLPDFYPDGALHSASLRALQRDLKELRSEGRIRVIDPNAKSLRYLAMDDEDFVDPLAKEFTLKQVEMQLKDVISPQQLQMILLQLRRPDSESQLDDSKILICSDALRLQLAEFSPMVMATVLRALAYNRALEISYRDQAGKSSTPILHPQGLIQRGPCVYLIALKNDEIEPRMYALHRMHKAAFLEQSARKADGFNLRAYQDSGHADFAGQEQLRLKLLVRGYVERLLYECPINASQQMVPQPEGAEFGSCLTVNVPNSGQLLRWLLGCGEHLKVVEPEQLRRSVASQARKMANLYT